MKLSKTIKILTNFLEIYGDLNCVDIEWTDKIDTKVSVTKISPCVVTDPNNLKNKLIIFD